MKELKDCFVVLLSKNFDWLSEFGYFLQKNNFKTASAFDLTQARRFIELTRPDLIVTDDAPSAVILKRENRAALYAPPWLPPRANRDEIIKELFPPERTHKRRHGRMKVNIDAVWEAPALTGHFLSGTVTNIGRRGVLVEPKEVLPTPGDVIPLEFTCADPELFTFQALGVVRWATGEPERESFGLEFISVSEPSADYLNKLEAPAPDGSQQPEQEPGVP